MSATRSRSEIESALTDKQTLPKRNLSSDQSNEFAAEFELESRNPRRQQVIGGALTGVSGRYRKSLLSKITEMHLTNWLAVLIVACILVAFFWPDNRESIREVADQQIETSSQPFYTESRIDEQETPQTPQTFSREDDLNRANQFREEEELQAQVEQFLQQASEHISRGDYTEPENANALFFYREILNLDNSNTAALKGIGELKTGFLESGQQALLDGNESRVSTALLGLRRIDAESQEFLSLTNSIEESRISTQIEDLLSKAVVAESENDLIFPAANNALHFFQEVLKLDDSNQAAIAGIDNIADYYIDQANSALVNGDLEAATGYLATASVVKDDHPSIETIKNMIVEAAPIAALRQTAREQNQVNTEEISNQSEPATDFEEIASPLPPITTPSNRQISDNRTPEQQASEQADFDQIYLNQGLDAYYKGDYTTAAALLQPLADKGVSRAQFRIGYMYYLGRGFDQNQTEADRILRAALPAIQNFATEGRSWAQSDLGSLYEDGLVLPRDYGEAVYWYRSAAEQGYSGAQTNLGIMYARGQGVSQSRQTAIEWFQRAAQQGDIAAIRNLESLGVN